MNKTLKRNLEYKQRATVRLFRLIYPDRRLVRHKGGGTGYSTSIGGDLPLTILPGRYVLYKPFSNGAITTMRDMRAVIKMQQWLERGD